MNSIELCSVSKKFGNTIALKNFSLKIKDREFIVLVGPSGCGKSTTIRIIAGLEEPSAGKVLIGNRVVNDLAPKDRDVAMVFQNYALYPHMNVYDNMAFGLRMHKVTKDDIDHRVRECAEILGLTDLLNRKPRQLSGGQKQRVALGRAIVRKTKVFLLDEPLSNLDAKLRVQMRAEIIKLHKKLNSTMVYVTHDQVEAMTMGDRIVVIKDGEIQQTGTPDEIYNQPVNQFVAGFIGMPPMNFLDWEPGVILGIRAEHIRLTEQRESAVLTEATGSGNKEYLIAGNVEVIEHTGAEKQVFLNTSFGQMVVRTEPAQTIKEESNFFLRFNANNVHLFDKASGMRLAQGL